MTTYLEFRDRSGISVNRGFKSLRPHSYLDIVKNSLTLRCIHHCELCCCTIEIQDWLMSHTRATPILIDQTLVTSIVVEVSLDSGEPNTALFEPS